MEQPMPQPNGRSEHQLQMNEAHEERIQRLEGTMTTIATEQAKTVTKLEFLGERVEESYAHIAQKIDRAFDSVTDRLDRGAAKIDANDKRLELVESAEATRTARVGLVKKFAYPLLIAAGSVIATGTGQMVWAWLNR